MKKCYVDCGAYKGKLIKQFLANKRYGSGFQVYALECSPHLSKIDYGKDVKVIRAAAWINDGFLKFYMNTKAPGIEGNSVYKDKITGNLDKNHPVTVPCIDFSAWLKRTFANDDLVIVKMNIEGAEYDVLEKCIADGTIRLIDELHVQWHVQKIPGIPSTRHDALVNTLAKLPFKVYNGYGHLKAAK